MPRRTRLYYCEDCGKLTFRARVSNDPRICVECGQDRARAGKPLGNRPVSFTVDEGGEVISP